MKTAYPSYGYWLTNGATTLWEHWSGEESHNHQMFGTVEEFFFKYLAGIRAPTDKNTSRAYKHIRIQPLVPKNLTWAEASLETVYGLISSKWQYQQELFELKVIIPANTTAEICFPYLSEEHKRITEGNHTVWRNGKFTGKVPGLRKAALNNNTISLVVDSGAYRFLMSR